MKKLLALLMALMLIVPAAMGEEEEITMGEILHGVDPAVVETTIVQPKSEEEIQAEEQAAMYEKDGSLLITITGTGDFTVGGDSRKSNSIFNNELEKQGGDIHFTMRNMRDILLADDLTIVNFEGTLTESTYVPPEKRENQFLFSAPPEYAAMLSENGVEAAALANNHVMDHGEEAYQDTQNALRDAGLVVSTGEEVAVVEVKGVKIALLSYLCIDRYDQLWDRVPADIAAAKAEYPIVIVNFHWGNETWYEPTKNQVKMGRLAVDAGADLVLGHHSHRIQPIEQYKGVYICYSLGNFCFAGNNRPSDMTSYVFQTRFRIRDGEVSSEGFRILPIRISSRTDYNNFIPTLLTKESSIDGMLNTLKESGRDLQYAVDRYPLDW